MGFKFSNAWYCETSEMESTPWDYELCTCNASIEDNNAGYYTDLTTIKRQSRKSCEKIEAMRFKKNFDDSSLISGLEILDLKALDFDGFKNLKRVNFQNQKRLSFLKIDRGSFDSPLTEVFKDLQALTHLRIIESITELNEKDFENFHELRDINLCCNKLKYLPENIFKNNPKLENIELYNNELTSIPFGFFDKFENIQIINLNRNKLESLPENLFKTTTKLREIRIRINKIISIPSRSFDTLKNIEIIDLKNNRCIDFRFDNSTEIKKMFEALKKCRFQCDSENETQSIFDHILFKVFFGYWKF